MKDFAVAYRNPKLALIRLTYELSRAGLAKRMMDICHERPTSILLIMSVFSPGLDAAPGTLFDKRRRREEQTRYCYELCYSL